MQINNQPVEKQILTPDGSLEIVNVWSTIQGEGPFAGQPAVFLRLAGCNLSSLCRYCDTDYTTNRRLQTVEEISQLVRDKTPKPYRTGWYSAKDLLVITGGEPFRQNIGPFVRDILDYGYKVQIETNGTFYLSDFPYHDAVTLVCSPKTGSINKDIPKVNFYLKYILDADKIDEKDGLPTSSLDSGVYPARPEGNEMGVYLQPLDEQDPVKNQRHLKAAAESCLKFGYTLSVQLHKLAGLE